MPAQQQNRKDILQAYRLMQERTSLALIAGEPDSPNQPLRRRNTATVSGLIVGAIAAALFLVLGLINKSGPVPGLTGSNAVSVDTDTGQYYVACTLADKQKAICPSLNYASALLAAGKSSTSGGGMPSIQKASQKDMAPYVTGPAIGISGLPDPPTEANLEKYQSPWAVCVSGHGSSQQTTLVGGQAVSGSTPLKASQGQATVVETQTSSPSPSDSDTHISNGASATSYWLLWNGTRLEIRQPSPSDPSPTSIISTVLKDHSPVETVPAAWLDAIPEGPDFQAPYIANLKSPAQAPPGTTGPATVGEVYTASNGSYVLEDDGKLASITSAQATLLTLKTGQGTPQSVSLATVSQDQSSQTVSSTGLPGNVPAITPLIQGASTSDAAIPVCVTYGSGLSTQITTGGTVPKGAPTTGQGAIVDRVAIPSGHGALVGVAPVANTSTPGASAPTATTWSLIVGSTRYPLATEGVEGMLGYKKSDEVLLPASLANLVPAGPGLNPDQVTKQVAGPSASSSPTAG